MLTIVAAVIVLVLASCRTSACSPCDRVSTDGAHYVFAEVEVRVDGLIQFRLMPTFAAKDVLYLIECINVNDGLMLSFNYLL